MWSSSSQHLCLAAIVLAVAIAPVGFAAEPSPKDKEAAKDAYIEGLELREKGNPAGALAKFQLAYKLVPSPITGLAVAKALEDQGQFVEARRVYKEIVALPPKPTESPEAKSAREQAAKNAKALDGKIARLVVIVRGFPTGVEPDQVAVDGRPIAYSKVGTEILVNPGKHVVTASSASAKKALKVEAIGGESVTATLDWEQAPTDVPSDPSPEVHAEPTTTNRLVWWGLGLGGVGLAASIGGFVHWRVNVNDCEEYRRDHEGAACKGENVRAGTTGLVIGALGGVVAVTGVALLIYGVATPVPTTTASRVQPASIWLSASPMGLSLYGRF